VKIDPHLSPLGGETEYTAISKFSSDLYSDVVDQDPSVKRFSGIIDMKEQKQKFSRSR
jgi:hypothetical protein